MADDFAQVRKTVDQLTDIVSGAPMSRVAEKAGQAGKKAALDAATKSLGGDRRFRNFKGKPPLNAGYDQAGATSVLINFRPSGLWNLAQSGRQGSGRIYPRGVTAKGNSRKGRGHQTHRAVMTPNGPRAHSSYGHSRGLGTFDDALNMAQIKVPEAASDQFDVEIGRALGG
jgi:hypothetical protein